MEEIIFSLSRENLHHQLDFCSKLFGVFHGIGFVGGNEVGDRSGFDSLYFFPDTNKHSIISNSYFFFAVGNSPLLGCHLRIFCCTELLEKFFDLFLFCHFCNFLRVRFPFDVEWRHWWKHIVVWVCGHFEGKFEYRLNAFLRTTILFKFLNPDLK